MHVHRETGGAREEEWEKGRRKRRGGEREFWNQWIPEERESTATP